MSVSEQVMLAQKPAFYKSLSLFDWVYALLIAVGAIYAHSQHGSLMDAYEVGTLYLMAAVFTALGWYWKAFRKLFIASGLISLFAVSVYQPAMENLAKKGITGKEAIAILADDKPGADRLAAPGQAKPEKQYNFFLKYMISSKAAIMWMSALFFGATLVYFIGMFARSEFAEKTGSGLAWSATTMGLVGLLVRWRESYLISPDIGHIPVSNLYEVFILFAVITAMMYLYYEGRYKTRSAGGFVMLVISASVIFLLWYGITRDADKIEGLIPALQSWWMKLHVPANFIGYGAFAMSAMIAVAYLIKARVIGDGQDRAGRLPTLEVMDDMMYKSIALGFAFFTIATVLGAMWAAEAWGGYWSWDPKETWALIVWLNYAAWLHLRLTKGLRGKPLAWWAIIGLFVTLFAFVGVNMFLSGMHSYGGL